MVSNMSLVLYDDNKTERGPSPSFDMFDSPVWMHTSTPASSPGRTSSSSWSLLSHPEESSNIFPFEESSSSETESHTQLNHDEDDNNIRCFNFDALLLAVDSEIAGHTTKERRPSGVVASEIREEEFAWLYNYPVSDLPRVWSQVESSTYSPEHPVSHNPEFDELASTYYTGKPLDIVARHREYYIHLLEVFEEPNESTETAAEEEEVEKVRDDKEIQGDT